MLVLNKSKQTKLRMDCTWRLPRLARSEDMTYVQLSFNEQVAFQTMRSIGKQPLLQLDDLGDPDLNIEAFRGLPHFSEHDHKTYIKRIKRRKARCDASIQRIRTLYLEMAKFGIELVKPLEGHQSFDEEKEHIDPLDEVEKDLGEVEESLGNAPIVLRQLREDIDATIEEMTLLDLFMDHILSSKDTIEDSVTYSREDEVLLYDQLDELKDLEALTSCSYPCGVIHMSKKVFFERSVCIVSLI